MSQEVTSNPTSLSLSKATNATMWSNMTNTLFVCPSDAFKAEYDAWNLEFNSLKQMLKERRPICSYVKKDPLAL